MAERPQPDAGSAHPDGEAPPEEAETTEAELPDTIEVPVAPGTDGAMDVMVALRRVNRTRHVVSLVSQAIIRAYDEEALYHEVCRDLVNYGGFLMAWVGIVEEAPALTIRPVGHAGIEPNFLQALKITWSDDVDHLGPTGEAVLEERPSVARNIPTDPHLEVLRKEAQPALRVSGVLCVSLAVWPPWHGSADRPRAGARRLRLRGGRAPSRARRRPGRWRRGAA